MCACARLLLVAALPALAGQGWWCAEGEVVVTEAGGSGPMFAPRQPTSAVLAQGQSAALDCRVLRLGDKTVSWVRSRDLQILSHDGAVFTADARVATSVSRDSRGVARHTLRIEGVRLSDAGRYECQVNTEPKMSLMFNLTVLDEPVPVVVVEAAGAGRAVRGRAGGAATLACAARLSPAASALPLPPLLVRWSRARDAEPLELQSARGGVSLETERWPARAESRLTLTELSADDAGEYVCSVGEATVTLRLLVDDDDEVVEEPMEAMQRDQASGARRGGGGGGRWWTLAALGAALAARTALLTA